MKTSKLEDQHTMLAIQVVWPEEPLEIHVETCLILGLQSSQDDQTQWPENVQHISLGSGHLD